MTSQHALEHRDWTYNDYLHLDDDNRYEIIEGALALVPAPDLGHQDIAGELYTAFRNHVLTHTAGKVFFAPVDVVLSAANIVQPDIMVVTAARADILQKRGIMGSPDIVVEILSPSSAHPDRNVKKKLYERFGVREYWIVDPQHRSVEVFMLKEGRYHLVSSAAGERRVQSELMHGLTVDMEKIFLSAP